MLTHERELGRQFPTNKEHMLSIRAREQSFHKTADCKAGGGPALHQGIRTNSGTQNTLIQTPREPTPSGPDRQCMVATSPQGLRPRNETPQERPGAVAAHLLLLEHTRI